MHKASFFQKAAHQAVICSLCPHHCRIQPNEYGICGTRQNVDGELVAKSFGKLTALYPDPIEKKPLYHFYPGSHILSLGSFGCNLRCLFCQNHQISQAQNTDVFSYSCYEPGDVVQRAGGLKDNTGIAYTYNEPVVNYEFVTETANLAREQGLKNVVVSNGVINSAPMERWLELIDAFNIDLKAFDDDFYPQIARGSLDPVLRSLKAIASHHIHLEITHLVVPGLNDSIKPFREMVKWIAGELGQATPLHISRYFPAYHFMQEDPTSLDILMKFYEEARLHLSYVFPGNIGISQGWADTRCPICNSLVIERAGFQAKIRDATPDGKCAGCQTEIFTNS